MPCRTIIQSARNRSQPNSSHVIPVSGHATKIHGIGRSASSDVWFHPNCTNLIPYQTNTSANGSIKLIDTIGTGRLFDWSVAVAAKQYAPTIVLAGGLNPENVGLAIKMVKPYGVDVCSGVESKPGQKDKQLLRAFLNEVERTRTEVGRTGALSGQMQEWLEA